MLSEDHATATQLTCTEHFVKFGMWFLRQACGQTDGQTDRHVDRNALHP